LYSFIYDLLLCVSRGVIVPYFKIYVLNIAWCLGDNIAIHFSCSYYSMWFMDLNLGYHVLVGACSSLEEVTSYFPWQSALLFDIWIW
jgi:hypothetical protein